MTSKKPAPANDKVITVYRYEGSGASDCESDDRKVNVVAEVWRGAPGDGQTLDTGWFPTKKAALAWAKKTYPDVKVLYSTEFRRADKRNIGKPGYCKFCGCQETAHGHYPNGFEDWDCPRCGYCEDHHLPDPRIAQPAIERTSDVNNTITHQAAESDPTHARSERCNGLDRAVTNEAADGRTVGSPRADAPYMEPGHCADEKGKGVLMSYPSNQSILHASHIPGRQPADLPKYPAWQRAIRAAQAITEEKIEELDRQHRIEQESKNREYGLNLAKALAFFGITLPEPPTDNSVYIDGFHFWLGTIGSSLDSKPAYNEFIHAENNKPNVRFDLYVSADLRSDDFADYSYHSTEFVKVRMETTDDFSELRSDLAYKMDAVHDAYQSAHEAYLKNKANAALLEAAKTFPPNVSTETQRTINYLQELIDLLEFSPEKLTPGDKLLLAAVEALSWAKQPIHAETFAADL